MKNKMDKNSEKAGTEKFRICYKKDIILVAAVLAAAVILLFAYRIGSSGNNRETADGVLEVMIDGDLYGNFPLSEDREMIVTSSYGNNTVVIEQGRAYVKEADCPDKICEGMQKISGDGEVICCLPHRLFLTVRGGDSAGYDAVVY